jgi:anti-sigma B factor antagonist
MTTTLQVEQRIDGGEVILVLTGSLTLGEHVDLLSSTISELSRNGHRRFVLDMQGVSYVDSMGLGELVRIYVSLSMEAGTSIRIVHPSERLKRLLELTGLSGLRHSNQVLGSHQPKPYEISWGVRIGVGVGLLVVIVAAIVWTLGGL